MNIPKVSHNELLHILDMGYQTMLPMFIHGTFGIGKTDTVENFCKRIAEKKGLKYSTDVKDINKEDYFMCLIIPMTLYDNVNLGGIPVRDGDKTVFLPTSLLPRKGQGLLFFDELNLAPPLTQSTVYGVIQKGVIGELVLPKTYMRIGAGNMDSDVAHIFEMANPLKNRFLHCELNKPTVERWIKDFAIKNGIDNRIIAFLSAHEHRLFSYDSNAVNSDIAIATPRTWAMLSPAIKPLNDNDKMLEIYTGMAVGTAIATEFMGFMKMVLSYGNIAEIFAGKKFAVPKEIDQTYAFISAILSYYLKIVEGNAKSQEKDNTLKRFYELTQMLNKEYMLTALYLASDQDGEFFERLSRVVSEKKMTEISDMIIEFSV